MHIEEVDKTVTLDALSGLMLDIAKREHIDADVLVRMAIWDYFGLMGYSPHPGLRATLSGIRQEGIMRLLGVNYNDDDGMEPGLWDLVTEE